MFEFYKDKAAVLVLEPLVPITVKPNAYMCKSNSAVNSVVPEMVPAASAAWFPQVTLIPVRSLPQTVVNELASDIFLLVLDQSLNQSIN